MTFLNYYLFTFQCFTRHWYYWLGARKGICLPKNPAAAVTRSFHNGRWVL